MSFYKQNGSGSDLKLARVRPHAHIKYCTPGSANFTSTGHASTPARPHASHCMSGGLGLWQRLHTCPAGE